MFDLPEAKRVRREDLYSSGSESQSSSENDADIRAQLEAQVSRTLVFGDADIASIKQRPRTKSSAASPGSPREAHQSSGKPKENLGEEGGLEEYDFCLFGGSEAQPAKVILEDENEPPGEGGFVVPKRPLSYYMANEPSLEQRQEYEFAAVSADEVLSRSHWRRWSLEVPWKVTHISVARKGAKSTSTTSTDDEITITKRKRPGKKRRIAMRLKERASKTKAEAAAAQQVEKEEHIKDKKKRLNRLKKLRRRAKNREQKEGKDGENKDDDSDGSGSE